MDAIVAIARNIVNTTYDSLPRDAVDATKMDILDVLGTAVAGSTAAGVEELAGLAKEWGGKPESTVIAHDCRLPAPMAALVNAMMGHARDYDDMHDKAILHAAVTVVPASFATAQRIGQVSGKELIAAVALGIDLICRMGLASKLNLRQSGWVYTSIYGYFGAAAAASKLLGLSEEQTSNALGIAYSQTAGSFQAIGDAVLTKRMQPGFAAKAGVLSALLAERGITGTRNTLEGEWGLYQVYHRGAYDPEQLTLDLGRWFEVANIGFKAYPSCAYTHSPINATLTLVRQHDIKPPDIEAITVCTGENSNDLFEPLERKRKPESIPDSQWSIPYTVATAAVKRKVGISDFSATAIEDPEVLRIAQKVSPRIVPELTRREVEPVIVEIKTRDGHVYSQRVEHRPGDPRNPISMEELIDKFRDCALHGKKRLPEDSIGGLIEKIAQLERVDDVGQIIRLVE